MEYFVAHSSFKSSKFEFTDFRQFLKTVNLGKSKAGKVSPDRNKRQNPCIHNY